MMTNREESLTIALADCLERLSQGESLENCLAAYPHLAGELRPLLQSAVLLKKRPGSILSPAQIDAIQARFLQKVRPPAKKSSAWKGIIVALTTILLVGLGIVILLNLGQDDRGEIIETLATQTPSTTFTPTTTASPTGTFTPTIPATLTPTATMAATATPTATATLIPEATPTPTPTPVISENALPGSATVPLWAGQTINVGQLAIANDATHLYVTFNTSNGWLIEQTHVDVRGTPFADGEIPKPGQFAYKTDPHDPGTTEFTYTIPLASLAGISSGSQIVILAHASVINGSQQETAWGGNSRASARRWYFYAVYTVQ